MALVTRDARASMDAATGMFAEQISGLVAGENLDPLAPCHIEGNGKVYMSNGAQAGAAATAAELEDAKVDGFCVQSVLAGEAVTLFGRGLRARYASGLTPGQNLYVGATVGRLDTAASTLGTKVVARAITATDIVVLDKA